MNSFFAEMKALYASRRLSDIDTFMDKRIADNCVVMGTALGELERTREDVRELFDSDLRWWYDLSIYDERAVHEELGEETLLSCPAEISYVIHENNERYESYSKWCDSITEDSLLSPSQKGAQIAYILDTLLSSREHKRRKNRLSLTIRALMRGDKAVFISFAFDKTIDTADNYIGDSTDTAESYAEERALLNQTELPAVAAILAQYGYEDAKYESPDRSLFYGVALQRRTETLDEAMAAVLADYKRDDVRSSLFALRLRIAYLQKVYALEQHPKAVVRFFGLTDKNGVALFVPVFPLSYYIECN